MRKYLETIKKARIFRGIPDNEFETMLETLDIQLKHYSEAQIIVREGQRIHRAAVLLEGKAVLYQDDFWGRHQELTVIEPGDLFAENYACARNLPADCSASAKEPSVVLWFSIQDLISDQNGSPFRELILKNMLSELARRNMNLYATIRHVRPQKTREKLLSYLSEEALRAHCAEFDIPYDRRQLAEYLGVERSAMSSTLSSLAKEGWLKTEKNHFILLKRPMDHLPE
ncbi:MAG: Crp/Fnr family transcriptional regulator [Erysipelotrichaceae bacterium]|jgi:CRP-like cAMP-binding protein|nr:Crp/Fnr family transcriptional regulator [Erysipelotrichaceae bacterium]